MPGRQKETHGKSEERLVKTEQSLLYNWHHQSIITVMMTVLSLLELQNGPEVHVFVPSTSMLIM